MISKIKTPLTGHLWVKLKSKIQKTFTLFIRSRKIWKRPSKAEVLIYDACGKEVLTPYFEKYRIEILEVRGESINLLAVCKAMFQPLFWKGKPYQAYINQYIKMSSPKIIITFIDNNKLFYEISKIFPHIKTIFIQNGRRTESGDIFGILKKKRNNTMLITCSFLDQQLAIIT